MLQGGCEEQGTFLVSVKEMCQFEATFSCFGHLEAVEQSINTLSSYSYCAEHVNNIYIISIYIYLRTHSRHGET